jgi:hypothetical protein
MKSKVSYPDFTLPVLKSLLKNRFKADSEYPKKYNFFSKSTLKSPFFQAHKPNYSSSRIAMV